MSANCTHKTCSICSNTKPVEEFRPKGRWCLTCRNSIQRLQRAESGNLHTAKYEKSPKGFVMRSYRNMLSRVTGVQKREAKFYLGLEILDRHVFYDWSLETESNFWPLYETWKELGYPRKLTPSVDRINVFRGYTLDNMRWVTHSQNSANLTRRHNRKAA